MGHHHYSDIIMGTTASQITSLTIVFSTVYADADQRKHQSSASPAFVRGINRGPVKPPHKWPVTRKMFPFDDVIMMINAAWILQVVLFISVLHPIYYLPERTYLHACYVCIESSSVLLQTRKFERIVLILMCDCCTLWDLSMSLLSNFI